jgi:hypothetical protein
MESAEHPQPPERPVVIACRVMEPELEAVRAGSQAIEIIYLEQGLHQTPKKLPGMIQERIDQAASYATVISSGLRRDVHVDHIPDRHWIADLFHCSGTEN